MSRADRKRLLPMRSSSLRRELAAEVDVIARIYAPEGDATSLEAVAATLEANAEKIVVGRERLRLWTLLLRNRAATLR